MASSYVNDCVLLVALAYSCADLACEWQRFSTCRWPVHQWLLVSYVTVMALRCVGLAGAQRSDDGGGFLLNLRQKDRGLRLLVATTWCCALPFFTLWTAAGSAMLLDVRAKTPGCLPPGSTAWFLFLWQALSY